MCIILLFHAQTPEFYFSLLRQVECAPWYPHHHFTANDILVFRTVIPRQRHMPCVPVSSLLGLFPTEDFCLTGISSSLCIPFHPALALLKMLNRLIVMMTCHALIT